MRANSHVRFLGEGAAETLPPYPTFMGTRKPQAGLGSRLPGQPTGLRRHRRRLKTSAPESSCTSVAWVSCRSSGCTTNELGIATVAEGLAACAYPPHVL